MDNTTPATTPEPAPRRSLFETIVTSTPVLLTVIATFLVGQSSSEMTRAQYFRSVASQNQSKVADQWGFYQAKRIRGQVLEGNADLLLSQRRDAFTRTTIPGAAQAVVKELNAAVEHVAKTQPGGASKESLDKLKTLAADADKALAAARGAFNPPGEGWKGERHTLKPAGVQAAMDALQNKIDRKLGPAAKVEDDQAKLLTEVINDIRKRVHEEKIAPKVLGLTDVTLNHAIEDAEARADEVYWRGKAIENVLEEFDSLMARQSTLTAEYQEIVSRIKEQEKAETPLGAELERRAETLRTLNARMQGDYKAVRHAYSARRYEDDARSNQDSAYLFEVRVQLSAARSDKHLFRSKMFMFAMLVAQTGVTIATLAIAVRRKSVFWLLATVAGLIAVALGAYVYLDLWPMPTL